MIEKNQFQKLYDRKVAPKIKVEWLRFFGIAVLAVVVGSFVYDILLAIIWVCLSLI